MDSLVENLRAVVGRESVICDADELLVYECDGLTHYKARPRAVVFPRSTEEVSSVVRVLSRARVPFAPRGAGTGLSGGALALANGVVVELARMRRVLELDAENRTATVETGLVNAHLTRAARPFKLHYAPDPSSQATCTVGGNIAENAGGIHCLKYGVTVDHVLSARVVLPDGEVVTLESGERGAGYDLLGLFVGSEGTFGLATEATVKLTPLPESVRTLLADFTNVTDASRAVSDIIASGLIPAALEMVDGATIRAVEASVFAAGLPADAEAALLIELDGLDAGLDEEAREAEAICRRHGARHVRRAADEAERLKLWAARKGAFGAMGRLAPDLMLQDAVVPRSRLPEVLAETYRVGERYGLRVANVFHAGDGNLHPYICYDARRPEEVERVHEAGREIMETCVRAGGTITGEHGVGLDKSAYLPLIFGADDLDAMLRVREAFDPDGLCNPGKILPAPGGCGEARAVARQSNGNASARRSDDLDAATRRRGDTAIQQRESEKTRERAHVNASPSTSASRPSPSLRALSNLVGEAHVSSLRVGGCGEVLAVAPGSVEEAREVVRAAARGGWKVVPAGACSWLDAGRRLEGVDLVLRTSRLARVVEHEPADLVATVEAGLTLGALDGALARANQRLPLDPPGGPRATLGGVAATGLAGPHALGYNAPRSHVLGMRVALGDGRVIKVGGRVVKNVAGYDLCKLFTGSYGTLGLILELTLKLRPRPAREATLVARSTERAALLKAARTVLASRLLPVAAELLSPTAARAVGASDDSREHALLLRFDGPSAAVAYQLDEAVKLLRAGAEVSPVETHDRDGALWRGLSELTTRAASDADGAALGWRARVLPTRLASLLDEAERLGRLAPETLWHAGVADGRLRVVEPSPSPVAEQAASLAKLRGVGPLVVETAAPELGRDFDVWGLDRAASRLMRRLKTRLDPADTFSPGRFF